MPGDRPGPFAVHDCGSCEFSIARCKVTTEHHLQANLSLVYCLDIYKPISAEVVAAIIGFKGIIGFGLSFGTNPWIAAEGYSKAFGEMALISGAVLALAIPVRRPFHFIADAVCLL